MDDSAETPPTKGQLWSILYLFFKEQGECCKNKKNISKVVKSINHRLGTHFIWTQHYIVHLHPSSGADHLFLIGMQYKIRIV